MWVLSHRGELEELPQDKPFLYNEVDISFSIFRQAVERGILRHVDTTDAGKTVWKLNQETAKSIEMDRSEK
jgi:hypothetical protein